MNFPAGQAAANALMRRQIGELGSFGLEAFLEPKAVLGRLAA